MAIISKDETGDHAMIRAACLLLLLLVVRPADAATPSNAAAGHTTRALYSYLASLPRQQTAKLVSGQHMGLTTSYAASNHTVAYGYDHFVKPLVTRTGRSVAIVGADYGPVDAVVTFPIDYAAINAPLLQHWKDGGLVTVMYSARNPWSGKNANDRTFGGPLAEVLQPGTAANAAWITQLDSLAAGLKALRDAGVVVLFRPLHEMNGAWFWWGYNPNSSTYAADIVAVWRHMHDYLSKTKGLDNLLWVYNVAPKGSALIPDEATLYPGDGYVDLVSLDLYAPSFDSAAINAYGRLKALGKPVALAEYAPTNKQWSGSFDYTLLLTEIRDKMPDLVYFQVWSDYGSAQTGYALLSLASNLNADKVLTDPMVVTIENLPASAHAISVASQDCLFNWAERTYPQLFAPATVVSANYEQYYYRYYSGTGNYLAASSADNYIWLLGPISGNAMFKFAPISNYLASTGCAQ